MPPLLLANWREINRRFCVLCWIMAAVLTLVIIGHLTAGPTACAARQADRSAATACGPPAAVLHPRH